MPTIRLITSLLIFIWAPKSLLGQQVNNTFPEDFLFGVATAAYQIEGAWNIDGKGPNIWDDLTHKHPELVADRSNGDVATDSYHLYGRDIELLKETKINIYRFSISWSRILSDGDVSSINPAGIDYYNKLIDILLENGIQPMVTMHHYDLPQALQDIGGFANVKIVDYFGEYANVLFTHFSDRVNLWITFNEPFDVCIDGYGNGNFAPLIKLPGVGEYYCMDNLIKAHATAYRLFQKKYKQKYPEGKIGITLSSRFFFSNDNRQDLIERAMQFQLGWTTHPIFSKTGGYPSIMVKDIENNSRREGRAWSRLPYLTESWTWFIKGSADFLGLNYYTSRIVGEANKPQGHIPSWQYDANLTYEIDPQWKQGKSKWLYSVPKGLSGLLKWIKDQYDNPIVMITENGWSDDGELEDMGRIDYLKSHMQEVLRAINEYKCNVKSYIVWSIIDNFEWMKGYTEKFGLYNVDFNSTTRERIPKKSAEFFRKVIDTRSVTD